MICSECGDYIDPALTDPGKLLWLEVLELCEPCAYLKVAAGEEL